ncbi:hypothetical protein BKA70DRAFT_1345094 [Coprinopsis sp. MPI-PUGE-AT-0042]|nr:hypothetical protein BKA70DRAFT_1345094 [Coprinopsis sp. MPI-PUGE-AT-0042]
MPCQGDGAWFGSLPPELWEEIALLASCCSQSSYHSLLLTCRWFHQTTRHQCLSLVPIRVAARRLSSFLEMVDTHPNIALQVRYLWITGNSKRVASVLASCKNLVSLACSGHALIALSGSSSTTGAGQIEHRELRELTLFDGWGQWSDLQHANSSPGFRICQQITHLRVHGTLARDFLTRRFTSLTHFSSSTSPLDSISFPRETDVLKSIADLKHIIICTYNWKDSTPDQKTRDLVEGSDARLRVVYFGGGEPGEFEIWSARTFEGLSSLWITEKPLRLLT